nr:peptide deformylase [Candidatus Dactylopiibacterium carminicum]
MQSRFTHSERYPEAPPIPYMALINPVLEVLDAREEDGWEGCLSVPGMRGMVPRAAGVRYRGFDAAGGLLEGEFTRFGFADQLSPHA